jgi:hypothetical protein
MLYSTETGIQARCEVESRVQDALDLKTTPLENAEAG